MKKAKATDSFSNGHTFGRVLSVVLTLTLLSAFIAAALLSFANDAYAFFTPTGEVLFSADSPLSLSDFSRHLEACGVISNPLAFTLYVRSKDKTELVESFLGSVTLDRSMSYREILLKISE